MLARTPVFLGRSLFPAGKVGRTVAVEMAKVMGMENFREERRPLVLRQHLLQQSHPARGRLVMVTTEEAVTPIRVRTQLS